MTRFGIAPVHPRLMTSGLLAALCVSLGAAGAADFTWIQDDWSGGAYASSSEIDPEIHPGLLVLENHLDDIRYLSTPTSYQGIYSLAVFRDTLFMAASDYPYVYDGADVIAYDYLTGQYSVPYQPYESGLHIIKQFGDSLYLPGPDSRDPWHTPGSIYMYTGSQWIEKATLPTAIHVNDVEVVDGVTYATTAHINGELHGAGAVWVSTDYGDTFARVFTLWPNLEHDIRRIFGLGSFAGRIFAQPDGFPPEDEVVYSTYNGTDWDTIPVPGMPADKQAFFTTWGDSLLMTIHNRMYIWDGEQFYGYWLPFDGYRWCRGVHKYEGHLYGGGLECGVYRWLQRSQWEEVGSLGLDPSTEEIESMATYYGRVYISTSRSQQGNPAHLYVTAASSFGRLISTVHDFGDAVGAGQLLWEGHRPGVQTLIRFQIRSGATMAELESAAFLGPDGQPDSYYMESGTPLPMAHRGHRYFQYLVDLLSPEGLDMPLMDRVTLEADSLDYAAVSGDEGVTGNRRSEARTTLAMEAPHPNPARGQVTLRLTFGGVLPGPGPAGADADGVELAILDLQGRLVRRARPVYEPGGSVAWTWDLRDARGRPVPAGIYRAVARHATNATSPETHHVRPIVVLP